MKNVKLKERQITELIHHFSKGRSFIAKNKDGSFVVSNTKLFKSIENDVWVGVNTSFRVWEKYDFLSWEDEEPFYFGDLFEVVYKGEVE